MKVEEVAYCAGLVDGEGSLKFLDAKKEGNFPLQTELYAQMKQLNHSRG